jgi:hypothetical protein
MDTLVQLTARYASRVIEIIVGQTASGACVTGARR